MVIIKVSFILAVENLLSSSPVKALTATISSRWIFTAPLSLFTIKATDKTALRLAKLSATQQGVQVVAATAGISKSIYVAPAPPAFCSDNLIL